MQECVCAVQNAAQKRKTPASECVGRGILDAPLQCCETGNFSVEWDGAPIWGVRDAASPGWRRVKHPAPYEQERKYRRRDAPYEWGRKYRQRNAPCEWGRKCRLGRARYTV